MKYHAIPTKTARELRRNQTNTEAVFWARLRTAGFNVEFRRQQPIGIYIVDFVSFGKKLIIEVDGGQHNEKVVMTKDEQRTAWLKSQGFHVLRFWDNDVLQNPEGVLQMVQNALAEVSPSPNLSHRGRGNKEG